LVLRSGVIFQEENMVECMATAISFSKYVSTAHRDNVQPNRHTQAA
jgi:hypothetical protein